MIYVIGGTMEAAEWYCKHELKISPRDRERVRVYSVQSGNGLRGVQFKEGDEVVCYAWYLAHWRQQDEWYEELNLMLRIAVVPVKWKERV
jgi:hypothetical protein